MRIAIDKNIYGGKPVYDAFYVLEEDDDHEKYSWIESFKVTDDDEVKAIDKLHFQVDEYIKSMEKYVKSMVNIKNELDELAFQTIDDINNSKGIKLVVNENYPAGWVEVLVRHEPTMDNMIDIGDDRIYPLSTRIDAITSVEKTEKEALVKLKSMLNSYRDVIDKYVETVNERIDERVNKPEINGE